MKIRPVTAADVAVWARLRHDLWPEEDAAELEREAARMAAGASSQSAFVAEDDEGTLVGFVEVSIRSVAEGFHDGPAAYVEGIYVVPDRRRCSVARALIAAAEQWGRAQGARWLGSDALIDNALSHAWHRGVGFAEIERLVIFGKPLD